MNTRNRNVDLEVDLGTLGRMTGRRTAAGSGTKDIIAPPMILQFDADRSAVVASTSTSDDGQVRSITLKEWDTPELVTVYQGKPNLLPIASIIEQTGTDSSRFGASGSARRGDAIYTVEHDVIRRAIVDALRPLRERYDVAMRGLDNEVVNTNDRTVDVYLVGNLAGGFANGAFVPTGIDILEAAAQHGLDRVRILPYLITPSTGNGADFRTAAAAATISIRQVQAACLRPELIRDEKLGGTRAPVTRIFEGPTLICPYNGRVTFAKRETAAALAALDINLRGDSRFSTDSFFTDFRSRINGGHIGTEMIWRAVGHTVIEFDPRRAADGLDARLTREIAQILHVGANAGDHVQLTVCTLSEVAGLLESAQRPTGTDVGTETYSALASAGYEAIQPTVQEAHTQLQQRADDYKHRLDTLVGHFVQENMLKLDQQVQHAIGTVGLANAAELLQRAKDRQQEVAGDYLQRYAATAGPDASGYQGLIAQLQEIAQSAARHSAVNATIVAIMIIAAIASLSVGMGMVFGVVGAILGWSLLSVGVVLATAAVMVKAFASQRDIKRMQQLAIEATNLDLAMFDSRINGIRLMAGRSAVNKLVDRLDRLHEVLGRVDRKAIELVADGDRRFKASAGGSVPIELPGISLPTNSDIEKVLGKMLTPRMGGLIGQVIPTCVLEAESMVGQIRQCVQAEIARLKLDDVSVIDFIEHWPNAIDIDTFATERVNESWPTAPLDVTAEPGYQPPILRVIRSDGGSRNSGPLLDRLRKVQVEEVDQARDQDFGDPRRIIVSHERRFISHRQLAFLAVLEREAQSVVMELEPFLVTAVQDPRALDVFRCGVARDESGAWGTFFRAVSRKIVTRKGDNTYLLRDVAVRSALHLTNDDGRLAQGLPNIINRLTTDPTLRRALDEMFLTELQRDGRKAIVQNYLAAMHSAADHVPVNAVSKFSEIGLREVCKLLPECRSADDAARLVGFTPPTPTPPTSKRDREAADEPANPLGVRARRHVHTKVADARAGEVSANGNGNGHRG